MRRTWGSLLGLSLTGSTGPIQGTSEMQHANHIFNAIHSSMRQWGSSLNHNGMSFFLATVPQGTQFYHGTDNHYQINGTEWLAFEPEHALAFARAQRMPPPPSAPGRHEHSHSMNHLGDYDEDAWHYTQSVGERSKYMPWHDTKANLQLKSAKNEKNGWSHHRNVQREHSRLTAHQQLLAPQKDVTPLENLHGYLHTYRTRHDLRLLYIDGQSAAKSLIGTLDTQDVVLLHHATRLPRSGHFSLAEQELPKSKMPRLGGPMNELFRAEHLCTLAKTEWKGRIDGFLRMELGFEIILCSSQKDLELERITQAKELDAGGPPSHGDNGDQLAYYHAIASRFDGIGGKRVHLNYDFFVSMFATPNTVYFDEAGLPRVRNETKLVRPVQDAIRDMVLQGRGPSQVNWQAVADNVVARYADLIEYLASGDLIELNSIKSEADRALRPFVDYGYRNRTHEMGRCVAQYVAQPSSSSYTATAAMVNVTTTICSTLLDIASANSSLKAIEKARDLKSWLAWSPWKRCRGCGYHEVCFVSIWPLGGFDEHEHPRCVSNMSEISNGYWGPLA